MKNRSTRRIATVVVSLSAILVVASPAAVGRAFADDDAPASRDARILPGDNSVPFWPHETGARFGTSETYIDVHADGSYYDPSVGRRIAR